MYLSYQQVASDGTVKTITVFTVPQGASFVEVQVDAQNVRYTMDLNNELPTSTKGMLFLTTEGPKEFMIEDFKRIRFTQVAAGAGNLNVHFSGRTIA